MEALSRANAMLEVDKDGVLIDINDNYLELIGCTREEMVGKYYDAAFGSVGSFETLINNIDEYGLQNGTYERHHKDGSLHYFKLMDYPVLDLQGEVERIIEFAVDVTHQKLLALESERRQAELKSYLSGINNTIASAEFSLDGCLIGANEIFLTVMGYSLAELQGTRITALMGSDQATLLMWESLQAGKFFSGEFRIRDKHGKELWLVGTFNPMLLGADKPEKVMMFAQFTTQEKEKVNELTAMLNALKAAVPVMEFNEQFQCKAGNEKWLRLFSLNRMQLRQLNILNFLDAQYEPAAKGEGAGY